MRTTRLAQGTTLVLGLAFLSVIAHFGNSADGIRTLDPWEMAATFGDDVTFEEPGTTSCNRGVIEGDTDCASCGDPAKAANDTRYICCKCGAKAKSGKCDATAGAAVCGQFNKYSGPRNGNADNCGRCNFVWNKIGSTCAGIHQATGAACEYPPDPG